MTHVPGDVDRRRHRRVSGGAGVEDTFGRAMDDLKKLSVERLRELARKHLGKGHSRLRTKAQLLEALKAVLREPLQRLREAAESVVPHGGSKVRVVDFPPGRKGRVRSEAAASRDGPVEPAAGSGNERSVPRGSGPGPRPRRARESRRRASRAGAARQPAPATPAVRRPTESRPGPRRRWRLPLLRLRPTPRSRRASSTRRRRPAGRGERLRLTPEPFEPGPFASPREVGTDAPVLLVRDPTTLFVFWDFRRELERGAALGLREPRLLLRLHRGADLDRTLELPLTSRSTYVTGLTSGQEYTAEVLLLGRDGWTRPVGSPQRPATAATGAGLDPARGAHAPAALVRAPLGELRRRPRASAPRARAAGLATTGPAAHQPRSPRARGPRPASPEALARGGTEATRVMRPPRGALLLVLHAHLPYVRHPDDEDHLEEEWLREAVLECYLPLLELLERLADERVPVRLTLSLTPTLVAMLQDPLLRSRIGRRIERQQGARRARGPQDARRRRAERRGPLLPGPAGAAGRAVARALPGRAGAGLRRAPRPGAAGAPGLGSDARIPPAPPSLAAGRPRPGGGGRRRARAGAGATARAASGSPSAATTPGWTGCWPRRSSASPSSTRTAWPTPSPARCSACTRPSSRRRGVAVYARDPDASEQVWSAEVGYPADPVYRDFYRDIGWDLPEDALVPVVGPGRPRRATGFKYHRITGARSGQGAVRRPSRRSPAPASTRATSSARVKERTGALVGRMERDPLVVAPYDAELFGHWWFEGPAFLEALFREAAAARPAGGDADGRSHRLARGAGGLAGREQLG